MTDYSRQYHIGALAKFGNACFPKPPKPNDRNAQPASISSSHGAAASARTSPLASANKHDPDSISLLRAT